MNLGLILSLAIPIALVVALFLRTGPEKPLNLRQLWITPIIAVASIGAALVLQKHPPFGPLVLVGLVVAFATGLTTGTLRAGTVRMRIDPETGTLLSQTASYAFVLFAALFGLRFVGELGGAGAARWTIGLFDSALLFAMAMIVAQRLGIFRRASRLMRQARQSGLPS